MCCPLVFEFSVGIGGFVIGLGQISFFFSCSKRTSEIIRYVANVIHRRPQIKQYTVSNEVEGRVTKRTVILYNY